MDDWGAFTAVGKKKKGKKGADPDPIPPPPPEPVDLGASATADANPDDEWLGFSTGKKKKGAKKGKVRALFWYSCGVCAIWTTITCNTKNVTHVLVKSISQQIRRHQMPCFAVSHPNNRLRESRDYPHTAAVKGGLARGVRRPDLRNLRQLACSSQHIDTALTHPPLHYLSIPPPYASVAFLSDQLF